MNSNLTIYEELILMSNLNSQLQKYTEGLTDKIYFKKAITVHESFIKYICLYVDRQCEVIRARIIGQSATTETETVKISKHIVWIYDHEWPALFRDLLTEQGDFERSWKLHHVISDFTQLSSTKMDEIRLRHDKEKKYNKPNPMSTWISL